MPGIAAVERGGGRGGDGRSCRLRRGHDGVDVTSIPHVVRQVDPAEALGSHGVKARVLSQLVLMPQHQAEAASLEEDRLLYLLPAPPQPLVERAGSRYVGNAQSDQADPLLHPVSMSASIRRSPRLAVSQAEGHLVRRGPSVTVPRWT